MEVRRTKMLNDIVVAVLMFCACGLSAWLNGYDKGYDEGYDAARALYREEGDDE